MVVWRLCRSAYSDLSGVGGIRYEGRWNKAGLPIVYASGNLSLCVLERRVHSAQQPKDDVALEIEVPDDNIEYLSSLPSGWQSRQDLTQTLGTEWLESKRSLCLAVPSVLVPEINYLINPLHKDFAKVQIRRIQPYRYDPRLFES